MDTWILGPALVALVSAALAAVVTWLVTRARYAALLSSAGTERDLLRERIGEVLRSLTPREREVIELRFGLRDGQPRTLEEVARAYGITRERIRQIEARGLLKLRQPLRSQRLAEFAETE